VRDLASGLRVCHRFKHSPHLWKIIFQATSDVKAAIARHDADIQCLQLYLLERGLQFEARRAYEATTASLPPDVASPPPLYERGVCRVAKLAVPTGPVEPAGSGHVLEGCRPLYGHNPVLEETFVCIVSSAVGAPVRDIPSFRHNRDTGTVPPPARDPGATCAQPHHGPARPRPLPFPTQPLILPPAFRLPRAPPLHPMIS
jgi:hypothetical protein